MIPTSTVMFINFRAQETPPPPQSIEEVVQLFNKGAFVFFSRWCFQQISANTLVTPAWCDPERVGKSGFKSFFV